MRKIFHHNKPLLLVQKLSPELSAPIPLQNTALVQDISQPSIESVLAKMHEDEILAGIIQFPNFDELVQAFESHFQVIKAAGGFVHCDGEALFIHRKGKWDLPKGKLDEGESLETCAHREIEEETGVRNLELIQPLLVTYHTYVEQGRSILKESHWYLFKAKEQPTLTPQTEEDITECRWVSLHTIDDYKPQMHASIVDVVTAAMNLLK